MLRVKRTPQLLVAIALSITALNFFCLQISCGAMHKGGLGIGVSFGSIWFVKERQHGIGSVYFSLDSYPLEKRSWYLTPQLSIKKHSDGIAVLYIFIPVWLLTSIGCVLFALVRVRSRNRLPDRCTCGYKLTGLAGQCCPECGDSLNVAKSNKSPS
jgi:hypothetical protein